jgi:ribosomal protein L5
VIGSMEGGSMADQHIAIRHAYPVPCALTIRVKSMVLFRSRLTQQTLPSVDPDRRAGNML